MAARRGILYAGVAAAGGVGYYLYSAGGDPKLAQKKAESDAAALSSKVKNELPGKGQELKAEGKKYGQEIGSRIDSGLDQAKQAGKDAENKLNAYSKDAQAKLDAARKDAGSKLTDAVDKFDQTVTEGASKAKSGISSWFGGK